MNEPSNKAKSIHKAMVIAAVVLAVFSLVAAVLVAVTYQGTEERIEQNKHDFILQSLNDVMPETAYDNDLIEDSYSVTDVLLGPIPNQVYPAFKNGNPAGIILTAVAPNGYSGKIKLLVGLNYAGVIHAIRVVEHKETPGLGDLIEGKRSNWIHQFKDRSINDPLKEQWLVKKDGGQFDQLTGATITPRAVIKAISNALLYYQLNQEALYKQATHNQPEDIQPENE